MPSPCRPLAAAGWLIDNRRRRICFSASHRSAISLDRRKLQGEVDQLLLAPVNQAKINAGTDLADFIANPMREQGSLRVIEHDTLLLIEPALVLVDLGRRSPCAQAAESCFASSPFTGSKTFPFQVKTFTKPAISPRSVVPGAMIATPLPSPCGISPAGLLAKDFIELISCDIFRNSCGSLIVGIFVRFHSLG